MEEFFLDVAAVVVGVAVYGWIRHKIRMRRYNAGYSSDPWDNW